MSEVASSETVDAVPKGVWTLGFVSLLMDTSSEMIHSLLPIFLVSVLGVGALSVGIIEGVAEATAAITKVFSGAVSDRLGRRKPLVLFGYGIAALTKPIFALAPTFGWVVGARFVDRVGKGVRGAPRDALVADLTPPHLLGAAFGLRQALDTVGAFAGPLIAIVAMWASADDFRLVFWIATIPALLAVLLILVGVKEPETRRTGNARRISWREAARLPIGFWKVVGVASLMTLARFSEGFLLLRAQSVGLEEMLVPLVFIVMNLVYAGCAYPVGTLSDRLGRRGLLLTGFTVLIVADVVLANAGTIFGVIGGVALWGLHMGMTQGLLAAMVAEHAPADQRGTAFGVFNLVSGVAALLASVIAGALWSAIGPQATFWAGAGFTACAILALVFRRGETLLNRP